MKFKPYNSDPEPSLTSEDSLSDLEPSLTSEDNLSERELLMRRHIEEEIYGTKGQRRRVALGISYGWYF